MSGENKPISKAFDWLKDTSEKIRTPLIALGALIAASVPGFQFLEPDAGTPQPDSLMQRA